MAPQLKSAGLVTRWVYCVALFSLLPATLLRSSGWVGVSLGQGGGGLLRKVVFLLIAAAVFFRIYQVLRYRHALDAAVPNKFVAALRFLSTAGMIVGGIAGLAIFFVRPLALLIFKTPGDFGVAFYVVGMYLAMIAPLGWKCCLAFEVTRWLGSLTTGGARRASPYHWKQDAIVAAILVALFLGGSYFKARSIQSDLERACSDTDRIVCVGTVTETLPRMVSLPMGSAVRLDSIVNSIRMQMADGARVKWEVVEGVANSLKVSGYEPSTDESLPVSVSVRAKGEGSGVRLEVQIAEKGENVARLEVLFPTGRLEKDSRGRFDLLVPLPPRSQGMIKGVWRDEDGDKQTIDQLYVFFRRAIGVEVEAAESLLRIVGTLESVKRVAVNEVQPELTQASFDSPCDGRFKMVPAKAILSHTAASQGWPMMELRFAGNDAPSPVTYVHRGDTIVCGTDAIWIEHSVPIEPQFSIRRFSPEGKLERFVEGTLPIVASNGIYGSIDGNSIREDRGAVFFDRVEVKLEKGGGYRRIAVARETFKVAVPEPVESPKPATP